MSITYLRKDTEPKTVPICSLQPYDYFSYRDGLFQFVSKETSAWGTKYVCLNHYDKTWSVFVEQNTPVIPVTVEGTVHWTNA